MKIAKHAGRTELLASTARNKSTNIIRLTFLQFERYFDFVDSFR